MRQNKFKKGDIINNLIILDKDKIVTTNNGSKVYYCHCADEDSTGLFIDTEKGRQWLDKPSQVKSIVTKEQMEQMEYKVM